MKRIVSAFAVLGLLLAHVACTPDDKNSSGGGNQNNQDELTVTGAALDVTDRSATLTGYANLPFELGDAEVGIMYDTQQSFEDGQKVAATALDGNNKFTVTVTGLAPSTTYYYKSYVQNGMAVKYGAVLSFTTKESTVPAGAVDLGIVMTRADGTTYILYWAKSNLSVNGLCSNPEDYGDYYAWGETAPYYSSQDPLTWKDGKSAGYDWATYKWCNGALDKLTRYCPENKANYWYGADTPDNKTEFADYNYADDAARATLHGMWRMPTDAEWTALRDNCTWTWTTENDVKGQRVTGPNGNSIFLPAAGYRLNTNFDHAGIYGDYWSSSLLKGYPYRAKFVSLHSKGVDVSNLDRRYGFSVRPVYEVENTGSEEPITGGGLVNYYGCKMSSSTVSSSAHVDINIYGTNVLEQSTGYGISRLKQTWASAICYVNGATYDLEATDGASFDSSDSQYGTFYWTWAFKNTTVMSALMNASTTNPVTIKMTDITGHDYSFVYSEPQTTRRSFYKYEGKE